MRVSLFLSILVVIRFAHHQNEFVDLELDDTTPAIEFVKSAFQESANIGPFDPSIDGNIVSDESGRKLGYLRQTSPECDHLIGYSGPTNCLIALSLENRIRAVAVLNSGDTIEHVAAVKQNERFLESFRGLGFETIDDWRDIDAVSGATLTSYAMVASVANRMGGSAPSLKFNPKPELTNVIKLFAEAAAIESTDQDSLWDVIDASGNRLGYVLSTTPAADHLSGYQGPTATLAGFDSQQKCIGLIVDQTYENQPYATYLNDDYGFLDYYSGQTLEEMAQMDPAGIGIEGVSGATMTSMCVADGLPLAAAAALNQNAATEATSTAVTRSLLSYWGDLITVILTLIGVAFSFTGLRNKKWFRCAFQVAVILILGYTTGHMLSQASIAGWSANSIPWTVAPGLVFLAIAALLVPVVTKHQPYCHHVCPFGALQQLGRNRVGWKIHISQSVSHALQWIPFVLLALVVIATVSRSRFNLAAIEPFDGFEFRIAGWATIAIFIVGLLVSLVSPMAYCRFGCPTGAMLNFLRFRADSDRLGLRDLAAVFLVAVALIGSIR